jgi:nitrite reductase (NADH) small subunit
VADWCAVAELSELERRKKKQVVVDGTPVALFLVGGEVYALDDTCIHKQRSLSKGVLLNGCIVCPGHQWAYDVATGYEATQECYQPTYDARVEDGTVYVAKTPRHIGAQDGDAAGLVSVTDSS